MEFKLKVHYFDKYLTVIADDNWQDIMKKKDKIKTQPNYSDWEGAFFVRNDSWTICVPATPSINEIVHETVHFVNELFSFIGYQPKLDNDEMQCYLTGYFSEEIYKKIYNIKKIK